MKSNDRFDWWNFLFFVNSGCLGGYLWETKWTENKQCISRFTHSPCKLENNLRSFFQHHSLNRSKKVGLSRLDLILKAFCLPNVIYLLIQPTKPGSLWDSIYPCINPSILINPAIRLVYAGLKGRRRRAIHIPTHKWFVSSYHVTIVWWPWNPSD